MSDAGGFADAAPAELRKDFLVVGLGGSAGSIPAFREFFRNVPPDSGMAYVVILHPSPEHDSRLAEVLQGSSAIPVTQVRERVRVEPDHVYAIPPNESLAMQDGMLVLSPVTRFDERRAPVDAFFHTLGEAHDSRAVCVVLSGSGSDGSMGLRRVKENNGLVLVQNPREAEFEEMPRHSIATGLVDMVLPVAEMPGRIIAYRDQLRARAEAALRRTEERYRTELETQVREGTAELKESRDLLKTTMDASVDMIQVFEAVRDESGEIVDFRWVLNNHSAEEKYGDVIGESLLARNPGVVEEGIFDDFKRVIETGEPIQKEHRYSHDQLDGWFLQSVVKLGDRVATTTKDITGWKSVQEQLQQRTRELAAISVQRQRLLERLVAATEEERQRLARELHDEMGQHLTALRISLQALKPQDEQVERMKNLIDRLDRSVDRLTFELRPPALDHLGLHGALTSLADEVSAATGVRVDSHLPGVESERFGDELETTVYRVVQEALTNVRKHSGAATVSVIVERDGDALRLIVEDDGRGFEAEGVLDGETAGGRLGLLGMRERLTMVGGSIHIESQPGSGTTIYVRVPVRRPPAPE